MTSKSWLLHEHVGQDEERAEEQEGSAEDRVDVEQTKNSAAG